MTFSLTILGCSSAMPTATRSLSSQVLEINQQYYLIDCGEGTQIQLRKFRIPFARINHVFISHLHGDHYYGLPGLLSSFNMMGRTGVLNIYAPAALEEEITTKKSLFIEELNFPINFNSLNFSEPQIIFEDKKVQITSFPVKHRIPTCGFLFRETQKERNIIKAKIADFNLSIKEIVAIKKGADYEDYNGQIIKNETLTLPPPATRSYAYCADTVYYEKIIPIIQNVDLLYHEATFLHNLLATAKSRYHTTAKQAAEIAVKAKVKQLIIGHFSARYKSIAELLTEAKDIFPNTFAAADGAVFDIKPT